MREFKVLSHMHVYQYSSVDFKVVTYLEREVVPDAASMHSRA